MWKYKNKIIKSIKDMPEGSYGFIYETKHIPTGKKYLGKKVLQFNRTLPPLKGTKRKRKVVKESDWLTYYGSHPEITTLIKEGKSLEFEREIIIFTNSKKLLTYYEIKFQMINQVLESDEYLNTNINGKFYKKDFK